MIKPGEIVSKKTLRLKYGLDRHTMDYFMNVQFYDELVKVGYKNKKSKNLTPLIVRKFIELYGEPYEENQ